MTSEAAVGALLDVHAAGLGQLVEARVLSEAEAEDTLRRWSARPRDRDQ
ncbi:MAG: hypothetical protein M3Z25_19980 [Actinomycetota bacterium]|nr:hypothetical protein [Actinomycetota bacterium]